jgi:hypothetical protein
MRYYLDCEFNGFGGELLSLALVPANPHATVMDFYVVIKPTQPLEQWVRDNVMPHLGEKPAIDREFAAGMLGAYLRQTPLSGDDDITIVADWPEDFSHFMNLLLTGPGRMVNVPDFNCEYRKMQGFNTADHSAIPHNALEDAKALRDYWEAHGA